MLLRLPLEYLGWKLYHVASHCSLLGGNINILMPSTLMSWANGVGSYPMTYGAVDSFHVEDDTTLNWEQKHLPSMYLPPSTTQSAC